MEIMKGYEPELQKMAVFLKERCDRDRYGLTYANTEKTLIRIPWPTVPRQNEDVSVNFGMFTEWAYLSRFKRGNRGDRVEKESLSAQKHRFRNALARADGLRQRKDLSSETVRVYELVDTKKDKDHANGKDHPRFRESSPPHTFADEMGRYSVASWAQPQVPPTDSFDSNPAFAGWDTPHYRPCVVSTSASQTPAYQAGTHQAQSELVDVPMDLQSEERVSLGSLLEEMINAPEPTVEQYAQSNDAYNATYTVPQPVRNEAHVVTTQGSPGNYQMASPLHVPDYRAVSQKQIPQPEQYVIVKAQILGEEVLNKPVHNSKGFRLYSGNNVPDMRRLLDDAQRSQLQLHTKYHCDELFGPEFFDQVEVPTPRGPAHRQCLRASQIIDNMDRGVIFYLEYLSDDGMQFNASSVPNVHAIRLCQTRVFPFDTNVENRASLEEEGLKRMQWVKVFDGAKFLRDIRKWAQYAGPTPSSTINLSVGQKARRDSVDFNLVTVKVLVTKAKQLIDQYFENQLVEIYISDKSSMDKAAQQHKDEIQARTMFGNGLAY